MPNKKKFKKLQLNALRKGKLNEQENVKETLKHIVAKSAIDNEDINFDFDEKKAGFEKLADNDACDKKIRKSMLAEAKKRKSFAEIEKEKEKEAKKQKLNDKKPPIQNNQAKSLDIVPKNSKKNKYFFMAHPEQLEKHAKSIEEISASTKFVIDEAKLKLNETLKKKKDIMKKNGTLETVKNDSTNNNTGMIKKGLWESGWCDSDDSQIPDNSDKFNENTITHEILDFSELDSKVKVKKRKERQSDGSFIEVFSHERIGNKITEESDKDQEKEKKQNVKEKDTNKKEIKNATQDSNCLTADKNNFEKAPEIKRNQMMDQLKSSRFRYLNELLYTQESDKSLKYFKKDTDAFGAYHEGFRNQVAKWPINPLDKIIKDIEKKSTGLIIADFGCGEAKLAQTVRNKVHSFDFVALNDLVVGCDMKKVPLNSSSCDVAVFCLSLMGTNIIEFLCEAHRVLKPNGILKIAEVVSRIEDRYIFIRKVESIGFKLNINKEEEEASKKEPYFYFFDFVKNSQVVKGMPDIKLTPCLYKKR